MDATCKTCPHHSPTGYCREATSTFAAESTSPEFWCSAHPLRQRDRLAAMALPAVIAGLPNGEWSSPESTARAAYEIADAMLAEAAAGLSPATTAGRDIS
jgi:hypothetical protein